MFIDNVTENVTGNATVGHQVCNEGALAAATGFAGLAFAAEGGYAIKCRVQSKRALRYIRLQLFPRTFR
jgi:hypothetical protein